jgi:hypothetical protein
MAGHALMVSEARIANKMAKVNIAAPLASQPKARSASGPETGLFRGGGLVMVRPVATFARLRAISEAGSVDDTISPLARLAVVSG